MADFFHSCVGQFGDTDFSVLDVDLGCVSKQFTTKMSNCSGGLQDVVEARTRKRLKLSAMAECGGESDEQQKVSHITVERNRRKQMNEHLSVLRSLMPCFYAKRGDQASIIGGVIDYITELQQVLRSLEAKKKRKVYSELTLSPRSLVSSPRKPPLSPRLSLPISPRKPPLSPRLSLPISPRTPLRASSYRPMVHPFIAPSFDTSSVGYLTSSDGTSSELVANSKPPIAEVEVKFVGGNLVVKTCSNRIRGQTTKVIHLLENLSLEVLQTNISVVDEVMVNSFTIKIGVECQLSAEELAQHIQQAFC
ncbi:hypothetical protein R6Q57_013332 [Mikania cordata]